jgi:membrane-associated phospholipid phosphatase
MALWGYIAGGYGVFLTLVAVSLPTVRRRAVAAVGSVAYACVAFGAATVPNFWVQLIVPGGLLLGGYWLSGLLFGTLQPWLERWLEATDLHTFRSLRVDHWLRAAPMWVLELLEAAYVLDYVVVGAGAIICAFAGVEAVARYWTLVLAAELTCYAALPFLRSRPPRSIEQPGVIAERAPLVRRLNIAILDRASVQANTIPSGHVAGAVAAALGVMMVSVPAGWVLLVVAVLISVSAVAGRYHYAVDCALGALVALVAASLVTP